MANSLQDSVAQATTLSEFEAAEWTNLRRQLHQLLRSRLGEGLVVGVISLNFLFVIIETDLEAAGKGSAVVMKVVDIVFLSFYIAELAVRLFVYRRPFFSQLWNVLDFSVVCVDIVGQVLSLSGLDIPSFSILRMLRLLRLARSFKVLVMFPQLALMVKGVFAAFQVILWGMVLLIVALLFFAILAVQLVHPVNERVAASGAYDDCERCPRAFSSVSQSALTFIQQIITGDSWGQVSIPIIEEAPWTGIFFSMVFVITNLMTLNVILSVIVDSSMKASQEDVQVLLRAKEREFKQNSKKLLELCAQIDRDGSGNLTKKELLAGFDSSPEFQEMLLLMDIKKEDMEAVFGMLDKDGSGDVNYSEFVQELHKMKNHDAHTMLIFIKYYVQEMKGMLSRVTGEVHRLMLEEASRGDSVMNNKLQAEAKHAAEGELREVLREVQRTLTDDLSRGMQDLVQKSNSQAQLLQSVREALHSGGAAATPSKWRDGVGHHALSDAPSGLAPLKLPQRPPPALDTPLGCCSVERGRPMHTRSAWLVPAPSSSAPQSGRPAMLPPAAHVGSNTGGMELH